MKYMIDFEIPFFDFKIDFKDILSKLKTILFYQGLITENTDLKQSDKKSDKTPPDSKFSLAKQIKNKFGHF